MRMEDVERAAGRLRGVIHETAVCSSRTFSELSGAEVFLKCENLQKTGSFKVRGAYNKIASIAEGGEVPPLVASSAGNHAQGVAYAASAVGSRAVIVMPRTTPIAKIAATEGYGAKVVLSGDCYDDAYREALSIRDETGAEFIHPFDDEAVIAGQATIALEVLRAMPTVDALLVPAGGGGLLAGVAFCAKSVNPRVKVIGVQARAYDAIARTFHGRGDEGEVEGCRPTTIADGIAVKQPGDITAGLIAEYVDDIVTVTDEEIAETILLLIERTKLIVEPAGAASLAAALGGKADIAGKRVACVLSGGNIDVGFIHKVVEKGLITRGRQMKFATVMPDVPGSLQRCSTLIAESGANVILVQHDRLRADLHLSEAILHVACEVSSREHGEQLIEQLERAGYRIMLESS